MSNFISNYRKSFPATCLNSVWMCNFEPVSTGSQIHGWTVTTVITSNRAAASLSADLHLHDSCEITRTHESNTLVHKYRDLLSSLGKFLV